MRAGGPDVLVRSWNLYHGNSVPPQRRGFLREMIDLATADQPDVLCVQEVPAWALGRFSVGDLASRPPFGTTLGRTVTAVHHGVIRGGVAGQGLAIWLAPTTRLLERHVFALNPRDFRRREGREFGLSAAAKWTWAKERRITQVVRLGVGDRTVVVANIHCTPCPGDSRIPDAELMRAAELAISVVRPDDVLVLAGDFNVGIRKSRVLPDLVRDWGFSAPGRGIDQVIVRGAAVAPLRIWPVERRRTADGVVLSDHAPVERELPHIPPVHASYDPES